MVLHPEWAPGLSMFLRNFTILCAGIPLAPQFCPTLCNPMDCSTPGFPVLHCLPEFAQTHVHWVNDAIQPSHLLSPPSPPAFTLSQHQGLFQWVDSFTSGVQSIGTVGLVDCSLSIKLSSKRGLASWLKLPSWVTGKACCWTTGFWFEGKKKCCPL